MFRRFYPLLAAVLVVLPLISSLLSVGEAWAKAVGSSANQYGPVSITISTPCPTMQTIATLPIDHSQLQSITVSGQVNGTAHLRDKTGAIDKIVSGSYSFTTVNSDELDACTIGSGTSTLTLQGQLNWYSGIWAGYAVNGFNSSPNTYTTMTGSWTVPNATCSRILQENSQSSTWIGFGGVPNTGAAQMIEQIGTLQGCSYGNAEYEAVYDNYPQQETAITQGCSDTNHHTCTIVPATVKAGDNITVKITYIGNGIFQLEEYDFTHHWWIVFGISQSNSNSPSVRYTAEWIEEAPPPNTLTNFGQVNFSGCSVDGYPIRKAGPIIQQITMKHNGGSIMAQPLGLPGQGDSFSVLFENK